MTDEQYQRHQAELQPAINYLNSQEPHDANVLLRAAKTVLRELERIKPLVDSLSERCHKQSDLLSNRAEKPSRGPYLTIANLVLERDKAERIVKKLWNFIKEVTTYDNPATDRVPEAVPPGDGNHG